MAETREGCGVKVQAARREELYIWRTVNVHSASKANTNISILVVFLKASGKELKQPIHPTYFLACSRATSVQIALWGVAINIPNAFLFFFFLEEKLYFFFILLF